MPSTASSCSDLQHRGKSMRLTNSMNLIGRLLLVTASAFCATGSHAACQSEMRILSEDLAGVKLTSAQSQVVADKVLQARRHCWVHHEQKAMELINSARRTAGLKESSGEFEWETVPLESLENTPPRN